MEYIGKLENGSIIMVILTVRYRWDQPSFCVCLYLHTQQRGDETLTSILQILGTLASITGDEIVPEIVFLCCLHGSSFLLSDLVYNIKESLWFSIPYRFWECL